MSRGFQAKAMPALSLRIMAIVPNRQNGLLRTIWSDFLGKSGAEHQIVPRTNLPRFPTFVRPPLGNMIASLLDNCVCYFRQHPAKV